MNRFLLCLFILVISTTVNAKQAFTGIDFSGIYDCKGNDSHEGKYSGTVTMELVRSQSVNEYGAYKFKLEVPEYGIYLGQASSNGTHAAMHFALPDQSTEDYGTGIASFKKNKSGKWTFNKFYYEPAFKGGNYGIEQCVKR